MHKTTYGDQHIMYAMFIDKSNLGYFLCSLLYKYSFFSFAEINCTVFRASEHVSTDEMKMMVVGMKNPNTNIHKRYVVLLSSECQSGAQPSPESSGTYLPHPKSGGIERANAYNQIMHMIFTQALIPTV